MTFQMLLEEREMSMYYLSKISGVPKTTVIDICSGKSRIENCSVRTLSKLATALGVKIEDLLNLEPDNYRVGSGLP